jgi:ferrochelatase
MERSRAASGEATGIILMNLGGPWTLSDVGPFLRSLFDDREIIPFPGGPAMQSTWSRFLSAVRTPAVRKRYAAIGGGSPLLYWSRIQALGLVRRLNRGRPAPLSREELEGLRGWGAREAGLPQDPRGGDDSFVAAIAMRYSEPSASAALAYLAERGLRRAVVLPLYPQECAATTGSSLSDLRRAMERSGRPIELDVIRSYHDHPLYLRAMAEKIREGLEVFPAAVRREVVILFSAHGVPIRIAESGDPYVRQIGETVEGLLRELSGEIGPHRLAWQSRVGPIRWTGPGTDEVLRELGKEGARGVLVVPLSFVSDHIETLHEIDIEFREVAHEAGIARFHRSPALNESPLFLDALRDLVLAAREG